jgi:hypothetical protein
MQSKLLQPALSAALALARADAHAAQRNIAMPWTISNRFPA